MTATVAGIHLGLDTHANRPAANTAPDGSMYSCSTHSLIYKSNYVGNSWATWATLGGAAVTDATITVTDVTTNNASTSAHGWLKKLSNVATQYMDGTGAWSVPAGSLTTAYGAATAAVTLSTPNTLTDSTGASISCTAGTWLLSATIVIKCGGTAGYAYAEIREGTNHIASGRGGIDNVNFSYCTIPIICQVTPGSTLTYKLSGQTGTATDTIERYANGTVITTQSHGYQGRVMYRRGDVESSPVFGWQRPCRVRRRIVHA